MESIPERCVVGCQQQPIGVGNQFFPTNASWGMLEAVRELPDRNQTPRPKFAEIGIAQGMLTRTSVRNRDHWGCRSTMDGDFTGVMQDHDSEKATSTAFKARYPCIVALFNIQTDRDIFQKSCSNFPAAVPRVLPKKLRSSTPLTHLFSLVLIGSTKSVCSGRETTGKGNLGSRRS